MDDSAPWKTEETIVGWPRLLVAVSFSFSCILQIWWLSPFLSSEEPRRPHAPGRENRESLLERNRSAVGKSQSPAELASALLYSCFASQVACPNRPSCPRDQSTY